MKFGQAVGVTVAILRNLVLAGNLISISLLSRPRRLMLYISESISLCKALGDNRGLPQKNVFDVLPSAEVESVQFGSLKAGGIWLETLPSHTADIVSLSLICQVLKPRLIFEIGTMRGHTSYQFALNTPDDARIITLDLPTDGSIRPALKTTVTDDQHIQLRNRSQRYCFADQPAADKITCVHGDSARFDYSPYFGKVDFFFIDGAHSYDYVRSDTLNALKCCHPGSVIAWHDFGRIGVNGVTRWLIELSRDHEIYSIPGGSLAFMVVK